MNLEISVNQASDQGNVVIDIAFHAAVVIPDEKYLAQNIAEAIERVGQEWTSSTGQPVTIRIPEELRK